MRTRRARVPRTCPRTEQSLMMIRRYNLWSSSELRHNSDEWDDFAPAEIPRTVVNGRYIKLSHCVSACIIYFAMALFDWDECCVNCSIMDAICYSVLFRVGFLNIYYIHFHFWGIVESRSMVCVILRSKPCRANGLVLSVNHCDHKTVNKGSRGKWRFPDSKTPNVGEPSLFFLG